MHFLASYWWLLIFPFAIYFWVQSLKRTSRTSWIWLLRLVGAMLVLGALVWFVTGDIETPYASLHMGGTSGAVIAIALGVVALLGAHRLAARARAAGPNDRLPSSDGRAA